MRVHLFKGKVGERASYPNLPIKTHALINVKNKDNLCGFYGVLAVIYPPRDNLNKVSNSTKYLPEIRTDVEDLTDGLKVDDIEKQEELNNLNPNVSELTEEETLTQHYLSTCWKFVMKTF